MANNQSGLLRRISRPPLEPPAAPSQENFGRALEASRGTTKLDLRAAAAVSHRQLAISCFLLGIGYFFEPARSANAK